MAWKHMAYHINNSNPGHTCLKQQLEQNLKIAFASLFKKKEKEKKYKGNCKAFYITHKWNNVWENVAFVVMLEIMT